ncbi:MAG: aminotransferase class V-fold PLP-dependent enzyme [Saprospiraceae bacterium]|nr:aminotransferase class V-fold PLP-dependent enzyme [Saprospiraceae bacterium]
MNYRSLFNLPEDCHYFNNSYMAPQLKSVTAIGKQFLEQKERPYNIFPADFFSYSEQLKQKFARLIHSDDPQRIALGPSASYCLANAANNVPLVQGDEILLTAEQFPSNVYCWEKAAANTSAKVMFIQKPIEKSISWTDQIIEAINSKTKVVAMGHVHWADGSLFDLMRIRKACDAVGAYLIIDGTQSVGALGFSIKEINPDALIVSGYKWMMGAYGMSLAYYGPRFDTGSPIEESWMNRKDSEDFAGLVNYESAYKSGANRYSMGQSSSFVYSAMLDKALEHLLDWGTDSIQNHGFDIMHLLKAELDNSPFTFGEQGEHAGHLWSLKLPEGLDKKQLKAKLKAHNVYLSIRGDYIRIASHLYNNDRDVEVLANVLKQF